MKVNKKSWADTYTAQRAWGFEKWIENMDEYCGKVLVLKAGHKCSMHYHMKKMETMYLARGSIEIKMIDAETAERYSVFLEPGDSVRIERGQAHQICALEDSDLIEFSTKHYEEDSFRIYRAEPPSDQ